MEVEHENFCRTRGDGMENEDVSKALETKQNIKPLAIDEKNTITKKNSNCKIPGEFTIYRPSESESKCVLSPVKPKGKLYCLIPKLIKKPQSNPADPSTFKKIREPKFIPIEPYKGAVNPIIPLKKQKKIIKKNKNNLDINFLVTQMSNMKASELQQNEKPAAEIDKKQIDPEKSRLLEENEKLRKDKDQINGQLKFQLQVNAELKNLLVASVGEDLQIKVNVLTEDKLQLARQLLDTANNLSTHTEQIEFLAGQCEVWRSKFLASSVLIEELARWKADLMQKNLFLIEANKSTLQLISKLREMQIDILKNLKFLANLKNLNLPSSDVLSLTSECLNICEQMVLHSEHSGMPDNLNLNDLDILTETEKFAAKALQNLSQPLAATEEASKAIVDQTFSSKSTIHDFNNKLNKSNSP